MRWVKKMTEQSGPTGMHKRELTLADGRYMIFYTFDEPGASSTESHAALETAERHVEPEARPEAEEERRV